MNTSNNSPNVFISYSHRDRKFVKKLASDLRMHGVNVWIDDLELHVGDSLLEKISQAINEVEYVLAVISAASIESDWVQTELKIAMLNDVGNKNIDVLPAIIQDCPIPEFLGDLAYADFREYYEVGFSQLIRTLIPGIASLKLDRARFVERPFILNLSLVLKDLPSGLFWLILAWLFSFVLVFLGRWILGYPSSSFLITVSVMPLIFFCFAMWNYAIVIGACSAGDETAKYQGRQTLNPLRSIDLLGCLVGIVTSALAGVPLAWTKPVPIRPARFSSGISSREALVRICCLPFVPVTSFLILCSLVVRLFWTGTIQPHSFLLASADLQPPNLAAFLLLNAAMGSAFICFVNLVPIPPMNGHYFLSIILGFRRGSELSERLSHIGPILLIACYFFLFLLLRGPISHLLSTMVAGISGIDVQQP